MKEFPYSGEYFSLSLLDQIWIQSVFEPNLPILVNFIKEEFTLLFKKEKLDDLSFKAHDLKKILTIIKTIEDN